MPVKGTSKVLGDLSEFSHFASDNKERPIFKFGLVELNNIVGNYGGIPGGSIIHLVADEQCGKTTLSFDLIATAQKNGNLRELELTIGKRTQIINAVFVDFERTFDPNYAALLGVDLDKLLILKTNYADESFMYLEHLLLSGIQLAVLDSIAVIVGKSEEDKEITEAEKIASGALLLTRAMKRLLAIVDNSDALLVCINQYRAEMQAMSRKTKHPYGARIMRHVSKLTIELARIKNEDDTAHIEFFVEKSKLGAGYKKTHFWLNRGQGPDYTREILTLAEKNDIIKKSGAWYYYEGQEGDYKAQGLEQAKEKFPIDEIRQKVLEVI